MTETALDIAKQLGPIAALCVVAGWAIGKALNKMVDRFLAGFDKLADKTDDNTRAVADLTVRSVEFEGEMDKKIGRLSSRIDGALGQRSYDSDQPPTKRARTAPLGYPVRARTNRDDEE